MIILILVVGLVVWGAIVLFGGLVGGWIAWYTNPDRRAKDGGMRWPQQKYGEPGFWASHDEEEDS